MMQVADAIESVKAIKADKDRYSQSPNGVEAIFVPLNDKWAAKLYKQANERNRAYNLQKAAALVGLGPEVGGIFNLPQTDDDYSYGYVTEIIEALYVGNRKTMFEEDQEPADELYDIMEEHSRELYPALLDKLDWNWVDMWPGNLGWKNGKLIPLDFGNYNDKWDYEPE